MKYCEAVIAVSEARRNFKQECHKYGLSIRWVDVERELTTQVEGFALTQNPTVSEQGRKNANKVLEECELYIGALKSHNRADLNASRDYMPVLIAGSLQDCRRFQADLSAGNTRLEVLIEVLGGRNVVNRLVYGKTLPALAI